MEGLTVWIRIISALLGIPLLVLVLVTGGGVLTAALTVVTLIALREFYCAFERVDVLPFQTAGLLSAAAIIITAGIYGRKGLELTSTIIIACMMVCFVMMIIQNKARITDLGVTLVGIVYIPVIFSLLLIMYNREMGPFMVWLVFVVAWLGDTFAYFIGISLGRHKLCPSISPKKSVEGAIGGLFGSVLGSATFGYIVWRLYGLDLGAANLAAVAFIGGISAQLGDLTASIIKRYAGVKDFGEIMPGHGGILDRFDSILFTIPVVYIGMGTHLLF
jgi:phosphatidate cytidylyltransferase